MHQLQKKRGDDNKKEKEKLEAIVKQSDQVGGQEAFDAKIKLDESKMPLIDDEVEDIFEDGIEDDEQQEKAKSKWSQIEALVGTQPRLEEVAKETDIQFFPNPAKNHIEITSNNLVEGTSSIIIYNILGEEVKKCQYSNFGNKQIINANGLTSGSYILEFENNDTFSRHKLIIE